jgi:hypothetical protein
MNADICREVYNLFSDLCNKQGLGIDFSIDDAMLEFYSHMYPREFDFAYDKHYDYFPEYSWDEVAKFSF